MAKKKKSAFFVVWGGGFWTPSPISPSPANSWGSEASTSSSKGACDPGQSIKVACPLWNSECFGVSHEPIGPMTLISMVFVGVLGKERP